MTARDAAWTQAPERSNAVALYVITRLALWCGRRVAALVLHPITLYFLCFSPTARRHAGRYLQRALGRSPGWRDLYRHFHAFATVALDRVFLLNDRFDLFDLRIGDTRAVDTGLAAGQGAFLVGAHVGSFEAMRAVGQRRSSFKVAMVMYPDNARLINEALAAIAPRAQVHVIPLGRMEAMLAVREWLDGGGMAGMLADRTLPRSSAADDGSGRLVTLPFLGRPARFGDGPFRLAALLRRRVFFMAAVFRGGRRYDVVVEPLADFSAGDATGRTRDEQVQAALRAYVQRLEALCRDAPYNWFNFHDFWQEDDAAA